MAVNQSAQRLNVADTLVNQIAKDLVEAYHASERLHNIYTMAGLTFPTGAFDNTALAHVDPADIPTIITRLEEFRTWMDTGNRKDILFKVMGS